MKKRKQKKGYISKPPAQWESRAHPAPKDAEKTGTTAPAEAPAGNIDLGDGVSAEEAELAGKTLAAARGRKDKRS